MPIPIDNVRLPEDIEQGAVGGPQWQTVIAVLDGGFEQTQQNWEDPRRSWNAGYGMQNKNDYSRILTFFHARRGRARGFLFKDWSDYQVNDQIIGTGNGVQDQFQITKTYDDTVLPYVRKITRPVASTLVVTLNGTPTTSYTLVAGGIIDFLSPPALGVVVRCTCEFDIPVRFDTDIMTVEMTWEDAATIPAVPIVEVRDA